MDRQIVYPGAIPLDTDILSIQRNAMIALGYVAQAAFGSSTVVDGLAITQTTVASMTINIGPGSVVSLATIDATAFGSLAADNTDPLVKVGVNTTATPFTLTAPVTSGQSINYLIEASFAESDGTAVVLPYYNASNPSVAYSGPANSGTAQNTVRAQRVQLQLKPGSPATTGTQTTPAVDSGWVGLYAITVNYGQTSITTSNLASVQLPAAPFVDPLKLGRGVQPGRLLNKRYFGTAGTSTYTPTAGTNSVRVTALGGGGAGGGGFATTSSTFAVGSGGASGSIGEGAFSSGFAGVTVTVGAAGAQVSGNPGGAGGTSSFGSLVSAPGGGGGQVAAVVSTSNIISGQGSPAAAATGSSGFIYGMQGQPGMNGFITNGLITSGQGAASRYGSGGANTSLGVGGPGSGFGAGGGGSANQFSASASLGGAGAPGLVIVEEYS